MKIGIVVPSLALKAPVIVARDLAHGFVSAGHVVTIFYFDDILELQFPCPTKRINFFNFRQLDGFDVVHSHMIRPDVFAWLCKKWRRSPSRFVTTVHNIVEEDLRFSYGKVISAIFSRVWRTAWSGLDGRVVLTDQALAYYSHTQPGVAFTRIYNGRSAHEMAAIDDLDAQVIRVAKERWRLIGACAVVTRRKGLEQVIRALAFLPQHAFLLIGDGPARQELMNLAQLLGVADRFISLGQKNNARDYLPYIDVYAMPSLSEGLPLALLEAVSAGVPAVCSDIPVFREVFSEQEVAYFTLDDVKGFAAAVDRVGAEGAVLHARAGQRFEACYTQDVMVRNYLSYFEALCQHARAR